MPCRSLTLLRRINAYVSHTFTIILGTACNQSITATDAVNHFTATTNSVTVAGPGLFSKFVDSILGGNTFAAGTAFQLTVQATDAFGNAVSRYSGPGSVTTTTSPGDPKSSFPIAGPLRNQ